MDTKKFVDGYMPHMLGSGRLEDAGQSLGRCRKAMSMTQSELGRSIGIKKARVSKLEGDGNPTVGSLAAAFKALGMKALTEIDPDVDEDVKVFLVHDLVESISRYARSEGIDEREAYKRLDAEGRIDRYLYSYDLFEGGEL